MLKEIFREHGTSQHLVVLVHGYDGTPRLLNDVVTEIRNAYPNADLLRPLYQQGRAHNENPFQIASELETRISEYAERRQRNGQAYEKIILIGYSMGALLIRKAYVYGKGSEEDRPGSRDHTPPNPWTERVERIILLAGINRGWSLDKRPSHKSTIVFQVERLLSVFLRWLPVGRMIKAIERGSPFVANLRLQWIRLAQRNPAAMAPVVQLLGTVDTRVTTNDDADLFVHQDFIFIPVDGATHSSLIRFERGTLGERCRNRFVEALTADIQTLRSKYEEAMNATRESVQSRDKHIVFVAHGIRDVGGWASDLADRISQMATQRNMEKVHVVPYRYKYFSFSGFLLSRMLPRFRLAHVRDFMDRYTEEIAHCPHPDSKVSFIGHSNGTYILANALKEYEALRIHRASFAGSVVPRHYPWNKMIREERRLDALRNDIAAGDYAVAIFPKMFEQLHWSDVGSGGYDGFIDSAANELEGRYYAGAHHAAIAPRNFESLARFILTGEVVREPALMIAEQKPTWLFIASKVATVSAILALAIITGIIVGGFALHLVIGWALILLLVAALVFI